MSPDRNSTEKIWSKMTFKLNNSLNHPLDGSTRWLGCRTPFNIESLLISVYRLVQYLNTLPDGLTK